MQAFLTSAYNVLNWLAPIAPVVCAAALIVNGILCAVGGEEGRQKAKKAILPVAIGCFCIVAGVNLGKEFVGLLVI